MQALIKIIGLVAIAMGLMILFFGLSSTDSFMEKVFERITGRFSEGTMYHIIGGVGAIVAGSALLFFSGRNPKH